MKQKQTIGYKTDINIAIVLLLVLAGLLLVATGIALFAIGIITGIIGGAIAGAMAATGCWVVWFGVYSKVAPKELVKLDKKNLYLNKRQIPLKDIIDVKAAGMILLIKTNQRRPIRQSFLKDSLDCAKQIKEAIN